MKARISEFEIVEEFLEEIKKEFGDGDKKLKEIAKLKELEQDQQTIDEYI